MITTRMGHTLQDDTRNEASYESYNDMDSCEEYAIQVNPAYTAAVFGELLNIPSPA